MTSSATGLCRLALALLLFLGLVPPALAHEYKVGGIEIVHPWSRATPGGAKVGGGYFTVENEGAADDRLVSITSDIADKIQIHEMAMSADGTSSMHELEAGLPLPAGATVELKPGAMHVMFIGLKHPLKEGEPFMATLNFEKAGPVEVKFVVGPIGATGGEAAHDHDHD